MSEVGLLLWKTWRREQPSPETRPRRNPGLERSRAIPLGRPELEVAECAPHGGAPGGVWPVRPGPRGSQRGTVIVPGGWIHLPQAPLTPPPRSHISHGSWGGRVNFSPGPPLLHTHTHTHL